MIDIKDAKDQISKQETLRVLKEKQINDLEAELISLNERSQELYYVLSNSDDSFKAEEYINLSEDLKELEISLKNSKSLPCAAT